MELTYHEYMDKLDIKIFPSEQTGSTLPLGRYEIPNINKTLGYFLPNFVEVSITFDDIRLRSIANIFFKLLISMKNLLIIPY